MSAADWASAIGVTLGSEGQPGLDATAIHVRSAVMVAGYLPRAQVLRGLREAFTPFRLEADVVRSLALRSLDALVEIGDLSRFETVAGPAYAPTPPRFIKVSDSSAVLLGGAELPGAAPALVRHAPLDAPAIGEVAPLANLEDEIGWPDWRLRLVELEGEDVPDGSAVDLWRRVSTLARGGERIAQEGPDSLRLLSGEGEFYGRHDGNSPTGRWAPMGRAGVFCGMRHTGYAWRPLVAEVTGEGARAWSPPDLDLWRWAVVGQTFQQGGQVFSYDHADGVLAARTPLPRQLRRLLRLTAVEIGAWRWQTDAHSARLAGSLIGQLL